MQHVQLNLNGAAPLAPSPTTTTLPTNNLRWRNPTQTRRCNAPPAGALPKPQGHPQHTVGRSAVLARCTMIPCCCRRCRRVPQLLSLSRTTQQHCMHARTREPSQFCRRASVRPLLPCCSHLLHARRLLLRLLGCWPLVDLQGTKSQHRSAHYACLRMRTAVCWTRPGWPAGWLVYTNHLLPAYGVQLPQHRGVTRLCAWSSPPQAAYSNPAMTWAISEEAWCCVGTTSAGDSPWMHSGSGVVGSASYCMARLDTVIGLRASQSKTAWTRGG